MATHSVTSPRKRKMHTILLITMLCMFVLVYNRKPILKEVYPDFLSKKEIPLEARRASNPYNINLIRMGIDTLRDGYLVVVSGTDSRSKLFSQMNRQDTSYSYAGIVMMENNYPFVYNVMHPQGKEKGGLHRDSFEVFVAARNNKGFGVYKLPISASALQSIKEIIGKYYKSGLAFDPYFRLGTKDKMYNTEFVYNVFSEATKNDKFFSYTYFGPYKYVTVDALFLRPKTQKIFSALYR